MAHARERDVERESNVRRYRDVIKRESMATEQNQTLTADFVQPLMVQHAAELTVEARIKRNKYNIQRTAADLDKNFAKRWFPAQISSPDCLLRQRAQQDENFAKQWHDA